MMNPLAAQGRLTEIMNGIRSGSIDARTEVLKMIQNMSPEQRRGLQPLVEKAQRIAANCGIGMGDFMQEISGHLS